MITAGKPTWLRMRAYRRLRCTTCSGWIPSRRWVFFSIDGLTYCRDCLTREIRRSAVEV